MASLPILDRQLMKLVPIQTNMIDYAWFKDGASALAEACETSGGEISGDQLKLLLSRGERTLLRMENDQGQGVGWGVVRVDQLPNFRVLWACEMVAHKASFEKYYEELKGIAKSLGCFRIRWAAKPAQARLYKQKLGATPVYEIQEVVL
jgi:hypothetical protein